MTHPNRRDKSFCNFEKLEDRNLLAGHPMTDVPDHDDAFSRMGSNSISDSGGFEGSNMTLMLPGMGGTTLDYRYEHFTIPDNFIIRYEGRNLLETGFTGGSRDGTVQVPMGNSNTVQVIVATNDSGTAWNYDVTANSCADTKPFSISLASGDFEHSTDASGTTVCKGTGTVFIGRTDGISQMLRVENSSIEFTDQKMEVSGQVFSQIGAGSVLSTPLFTGNFEIPFQTGTSTSFSDSKVATGEYELGGMPVDFAAISINRQTVSLEASFKLVEDLGFPDYLFNGPDGLIISQNDVSFGSSIKFSAPTFKDFPLFNYFKVKEFSNFSIEYIAPQDTVKIQGKLEVGLNSKASITTVEADLAGPNFLQIKGGEADIVGSLAIKRDLKFLPKKWGLKELKLSLDTIKQDVVGTAELLAPFGRGPESISIRGDLGFKLPLDPLELNKLGLAVDNLNYPVPSYPLVFIQGLRGSVENFAASDPDPIEFSGGISATLGPQIGGNSLIRVDVDGTLSSEEVSATGQVTIVDPKLFRSSGTVKLNWKDKFFESSGSVTMLDGFIQANDKFRANSNFDIDMSGMATASIPDSVPLIGGAQLGSSNYMLDFNNNSDSSDDFAAAWTTRTIEKLGFNVTIVIGFKGYFDGRFERIGSKNIPRTGQFQAPANSEWIMLGADWENPTNLDVPLRVTLPDGTVVEEADFADHDIAVLDEFGDSTTKVIMAFQPEAGTWKLDVVDSTGLGVVTYDGAIEDEAPMITVNSPATDVPGGLVDIQYVATDADSTAEVSLYFDTDDQDSDGVRIADGLVETDGAGSYVWDTHGMAPGNYHVYAVVFDGVNAPAVSYSTGTVQVGATADLNVSLSASATDITPGQEVLYTAEISNMGPEAADDVVVQVQLPEGAVFNWSSIQLSGLQDNIAEFDLGTLAASGLTSIDINVTVPDLAMLDEPQSLFASASAYGSTFDNDQSTNFDDLIIVSENPAAVLPDLAVTLTSAASSAGIGEEFSYTIKVTNEGQGTATDVLIEEFLPDFLRLQEVSTTKGTSTSVGTTSHVLRGVITEVGELAQGESVEVTFRLESDYAGKLVSSTLVSSNELDFTSRNNELITVTTVDTVVPSSADLGLDLTVSDVSPQNGDSIQISLTISNSGPGVASAIMVRVDLPSGLVVDSSSPEQGTFDPGTGIWDAGNIRDNLDRTLTINATVSGATSGLVVGEITSVGEVDPDSTPGNNVSSEDDQEAVSINGGTGPVTLPLTTSAGSIHDAVLPGKIVVLEGSLENVSANGVYSAMVDWKDGTTSPAILEVVNGETVVRASHIYDEGGNYRPVLKVMDNNGNSKMFIAKAYVIGASVNNGRLTIVGSPNADAVNVYPSSNGIGVYGSFIVGNHRWYAASEIGGMGIYVGNGNDSVVVNPVLTIPTRIVGGYGHDGLFGGGGVDSISGGEGNDFIKGFAGNDMLEGGAGHDRLEGMDGNDYIRGGNDNDFLFGGFGNDELRSGNGIDHVYGDFGNDIMHGGQHNDFLFGGHGNDQISGGFGDDMIWGDAGDDLLIGWDGNDRLFGGLGRDTLMGWLGFDWLYGENDDDYLDGGGDYDQLFGGHGTDQLYNGEVNHS